MVVAAANRRIKTCFGAGGRWPSRLRRSPRRPRWIPITALILAGLAYSAPAWRYLDSFDARDSADIQLQIRALSAAAPQTDQVIGYIETHGGGRTYGGSPSNWGQYFGVGLTPMYEYLDGANLDEVG